MIQWYVLVIGVLMTVTPIMDATASPGEIYQVGKSLILPREAPFPIIPDGKRSIDSVRLTPKWKLKIDASVSFARMCSENGVLWEIHGGREQSIAAFGDTSRHWYRCRLYDASDRPRGQAWLNDSLLSKISLSPVPFKIAEYLPPDTAFIRHALNHLRTYLANDIYWVDVKVPDVQGCTLHRRSRLSCEVIIPVISRNKFGETQRARYICIIEWENSDEWGMGTWLMPLLENGDYWIIK